MTTAAWRIAVESLACPANDLSGRKKHRGPLEQHRHQANLLFIEHCFGRSGGLDLHTNAPPSPPKCYIWSTNFGIRRNYAAGP